MSNVNGVQFQAKYGVDAASGEGERGTSVAPPPCRSAVLMREPIGVASLGGDTMTQLAVLLAQEDNQDRKASHEREASAVVAQEHENAAQVQALHEKADDIRSQGWAEGVCQIGQGVCELGAGVTTDKPGKLDVNDVCRSSAKAFGGAGSIIGKQYQAASILDDAGAQSHANAGKVDGQIAQGAHDDAADARSALEKVFSFLQGVREAQNAALSAAASMRG
jgi:hypothetical protein